MGEEVGEEVGGGGLVGEERWGGGWGRRGGGDMEVLYITGYSSKQQDKHPVEELHKLSHCRHCHSTVVHWVAKRQRKKTTPVTSSLQQDKKSNQ